MFPAEAAMSYSMQEDSLTTLLYLLLWGAQIEASYVKIGILLFFLEAGLHPETDSPLTWQQEHNYKQCIFDRV